MVSCVMTIRKEKKEGKQRRKQMVTTCIVIIIFILLLFLKMKEGTYGCGDFNKFFNQTKQEILEKNGEPIQREALNDDCECIAFDGVDYIFILDSPESARITDPDILFGILRIGVGSSKTEVMLAFGLKKRLINECENEYSVQNGIYAISFYFDENDRVYKIACGLGV